MRQTAMHAQAAQEVEAEERLLGIEARAARREPQERRR